MKVLRPYQQEIVDKIKLRLKQVTHPILIDCSVGGGKSIIISSILEWLEKKNYRVLCLTLNSTLIEQNYLSYKNQGYSPGIYCAALNAKDTKQSVIFGSPQSVAKGISNQLEISKQKFQMIVIDEAHNISPHDRNTMYQRILNHYGYMAQLEGYSYRVLGLTGTAYRGKSVSIVGEDQYFKEKVCEVSTSYLINEGYLTPPEFGKPICDTFDFKDLKVNNMGKFNQNQIDAVINKQERLTGEIMREVVEIIESGRNGAFIFCTSVKHCHEAMQSLPLNETAIITGETPHNVRKSILEKASRLEIKYLLSVGCLLVGVDLPIFDVCVFCRPTESLVLYIQAIGRVLRLHETKHNALIIDYAQNIERFGDIDNLIINKAVQEIKKDDPDYCIPCLDCNSLNTATARRCIGIHNNKRCNHYFEWKDCDKCGTKNDIVARECRNESCKTELIDPNKKLRKEKQQTYEVEVKTAKYWVSTMQNIDIPVVNAEYTTNYGKVFESYYLKNERVKNIFYGRFIKQHLDEGSLYYPYLLDKEKLKAIIDGSKIKTPYQLICVKNDYGRFQVQKKIFYSDNE